MENSQSLGYLKKALNGLLKAIALAGFRSVEEPR